MFEPRTTHHLATLQVRVCHPQGAAELGIESNDQDLYHVIANADAMKRLRRVAHELSRRINRDGAHEVREVIRELGDRLGGSPGIAAYRGVGIDASAAGAGELDDIWLASGDSVTRLALLHYTRFWVIPTPEQDYMLIHCHRGMRDRLLFTLENAVEQLGYRALIMWRVDGCYIGLGWRIPSKERRVFIDRPLNARNEIEAIREMGLKPDPLDSHWTRRIGRILRSFIAS